VASLPCLTPQGRAGSQRPLTFRAKVTLGAPQSPGFELHDGPAFGGSIDGRVTDGMPLASDDLRRTHGSPRHGSVYANRVRATYRAQDTALPAAEAHTAEATQRGTLSKRWAELVYRVYEVDPLTCPRCGARMKILAFIIDPKLIRQILDHLLKRARPRAPPDVSRAP
jgi:hypothetical protein